MFDKLKEQQKISIFANKLTTNGNYASEHLSVGIINTFYVR